MKIIASNKTKASIVLFTIQSNGENNVLLYLLFRSRDVTRLQIDPTTHSFVLKIGCK
jgi:hypothetical protein